CGAVLLEALQTAQTPHLDHLVDAFPGMLAQHGHSYRARVAHEVANVGFCAPNRRAFTGRGCRSSPGVRANAYRYRSKSGCVRLRITTRNPLSNKHLGCRKPSCSEI